MKHKKKIAGFEIFLLISLSFAFSFMFGESIEVVSAQFTATGPGANLIKTYATGTPVTPPSLTSSVPAQLPDTVLMPVADGGFSLRGPVDISTVGQSSNPFSFGMGGGGTGGGAGAVGAEGITTTVTANSVVSVTPAQVAAAQAHGGVMAGVSNFQVDGVALQNGLLTKDGTLIASDGTLFHSTGSGWSAGAGGTGAAGAAGTAGGYTGKGTMGSLLTGNYFASPLLSALLSGAIWGGIVGGVAYFLAGMFGLNPDQAASIGLGLGVGTFAGTSLYFYGQNMIAQGAYTAANLPFAISSFGATLIGVGIAAGIILMTYKETKKELVKFECLAWEQPRGGANCEECNNNPYMPCSEYRCKSLGAGCELINQGTEEETCFWVHKGDTAAPHIEPWADALAPNGLEYIPDTAISPPNRGFKIVDSEGDDCLPAFTNLQFGVIADEPAQCKVDITPAATYDEMAYLFGESNIYSKEHTQELKVPSPFTEEGDSNVIPEVHNDGTYTLWVRCIDPNGNGKDSALVAFRYCVDKGPDTTQPVIVSSSIRSGSPVQFNVDSVPIEVYVNEPAECRWSRQDKEFEFMENTMDCATESYQINADLNYACSAQLTGVENSADNWFYFRCMDYSTAPGGRNTMETSYPLLLKGTQPLIITKVGPTGEFTGSASVATVTLSVETDDGAAEGVAACFFDTSPDGTFDIAMENTNSYVHNQSLDLTSGAYTYYFRCIDAGSNRAETNTTFSVVIDSTLPGITRVFRDGDVLKVITDEDAKCYYSENTCNYALADGLPMTYENPTERTIHTVAWKEDITYYIKCEDLQGNQPRPDFCQIIAEASEL